MREQFLQIGLRLILVCLFGMFTNGVNAQLNIERSALNRLQSGKWERSLRLLQKSLRKDTSNVEATYVMTRWFLTPGNPEFQVDSAHHYINKSEKLFYQLSLRDRERVQRFPIDSLILQILHDKIDSTAFERAKLINTEEAYNRFLVSFPLAQQRNNAIELRDEVSFLEALKVNTYHSFNDYLVRYPQSHRAREAMDRYERLLFEEKTKDKKLSSYKSFFQNYPSSPYSALAQKEIFELITATGDLETFLLYIKEYPHGLFAKFARDILFHLSIESDEEIPSSIASDSLTQVIDLNSRFWIPFYKNGLFGFMDQEGQEILSPQFDEIEEEYKCGPIKDDILIVKSGVYSRTGKKLAEQGTVISHIGSGFLKAEREGCIYLMHKSGAIVISACHADYKIVGNNFIAAQNGQTWELFTLSGRPLNISGVDDVKELEGVIVLTRMEKKHLTTVDQIAGLTEHQELKDDLVFDEIVAIDKDLLWVRNGLLEGIINNQLKFTVPLDRHLLTKTSFGLIEKKPAGTIVWGLSSELENRIWNQVFLYRDWLVLNSEGTQQLFNIPSRKMVVTKADSIWFDHNLAFVLLDNSTKVHLSSSRSIDLLPDSKIRFINARDSVRFFYTESKGKRKIFNLASGDALFTTEFELTESLGNDLFMAAKGNKKGLLGLNGKEVVPVEMDAMILTQTGQISLLKDKKFGLFDFNSRKLIKPIYERNVTLLDKHHLIVFKDGFYGLIGWDTKPVTEFEFLEVIPWSDSVIWVKRNFQWTLLNFLTKEIVLDRIRDFSWVRKSHEENLALIHRENYYGVISSRKGLLIPPTFHEIINLGTPELPFYFTEKGVEEADIYVVIYYNQYGKLVRRQAYEEEEYDRIYCEAN
ncbi:MAG: WG repeat-containing protein [Cyclobacteriaceae bacterium]